MIALERQIVLTLFILIGTILLFSFTRIDFIVSDHFFDLKTHTWLLDRNLQPYKFIFYDGIKKLLIIFAVGLLASLIFLRNNSIIKEYRKGILVVVLSAILVPLITSGLKKTTNVSCPKNGIHYGGIYPETKIWEHYPTSFKQTKRIECWPAGHASGGFALLSLFFLFKSKKRKKMAIAVALIIGWSMGYYKMLIGDHFLSHTIIVMVIAWLTVLSIVKFIDTVQRLRFDKS